MGPNSVVSICFLFYPSILFSSTDFPAGSQVGSLSSWMRNQEPNILPIPSFPSLALAWLARCLVPRKEGALEGEEAGASRVKLGRGGGKPTGPPPSTPHLMNTVSLRRPCKSAWLARSQGQRVVPKGVALGVTRLWEALPGGWPGAGQGLVGTHPRFQPCSPLWPHPWGPCPLAFIASQGPALSEPGLKLGMLLCSSDPISLGLGKSCPSVPGACVLPLLPLLPRSHGSVLCLLSS